MKFKIYTVIGLLSFILLLPNVLQAQTVSERFPENAGFAACVASNLNKAVTDNITTNDVESITYLSCSNQGLTSIQDITQLTRLQEADLSNNRIVNVGVFGFLNEVTTINLSGNSTVIDLNTLIHVDRLVNLDLSNTRLSNLNILSEFTLIQNLNISNNNLSSIAFVSNMRSLQAINVSNNNLDSLIALQPLTNLVSIEATNNNFTNIDSLPASVRNLNLENNHIESVLPLNSFTNLNWIDLKSNNLSNIDFMTDNQSLTYVDVSNNPITSVVVVNTMGPLNVFTVDYQNLTDVDQVNQPNLGIIERNRGALNNNFEDREPEVQEPTSFDYYLNRIKNFVTNNLIESLIGLGLLLLIVIMSLVRRSHKKSLKEDHVLTSDDKPLEDNLIEQANYDDTDTSKETSKDIDVIDDVDDESHLNDEQTIVSQPVEQLEDDSKEEDIIDESLEQPINEEDIKEDIDQPIIKETKEELFNEDKTLQEEYKEEESIQDKSNEDESNDDESSNQSLSEVFDSLMPLKSEEAPEVLEDDSNLIPDTTFNREAKEESEDKE